MDNITYVDIDELKISLLELSIDFSNLELLIGISTGDYCGGCRSSVGDSEDIIRKMCDTISKTVLILELTTEVLLSADDDTGGSKIYLMDITKEIVSAVQIFLMTRSHIFNSEYSVTEIQCRCNNHQNIGRLGEVLFKVDKIK